MVEIVALDLPEVKLLRVKRHGDARGYFSEVYNKRVLAQHGIMTEFVQDNCSLSARRGTLRGLHFQRPPTAQCKLVRVVRGAIFDVAVDLRRGSPRYGRWTGATISAADGHQLLIPAEFAHGFVTLEPDTEVAYKVSAHYDAGCDAGIAWSDPDLAIGWPVAAADVILSEKDARLPRFKDFASPFRYVA